MQKLHSPAETRLRGFCAVVKVAAESYYNDPLQHEPVNKNDNALINIVGG